MRALVAGPCSDSSIEHGDRQAGRSDESLGMTGLCGVASLRSAPQVLIPRITRPFGMRVARDDIREALTVSSNASEEKRRRAVGDEWDIADGMALSRHGEQEDMSDVFEWGTATPESQGMDGARLEAMQRELAERDTKAFLVIRHDRLVWEWYAPDFSAGTPHYTASMAKVFVAGMSLLVQMADGRMDVDDPAWKYIPRWKDHALKSQITIRHLATHTSGIEDAEEPGKSLDELGGWKGAFWRGGRDPGPFAIALDQAPMLFAPGTSMAYSSPGMAALGYAITASLRGCQQSDLRSLLRARVMDPIGVPENHWRPGGDPPWELDGLRLYASWGGGHYTARAAARVGRLMLRRGDWEGQQVIDARRVCEALSPAAPGSRMRMPHSASPGGSTTAASGPACLGTHSQPEALGTKCC